MPTQDAISLLKADHKKVREMFASFHEIGDRAFAQRQKLGLQIAAELAAHSKAEEEVLYPAMKERARPNTEERDVLLEGMQEHELVDGLVEQIKATDARDEMFKTKVNVAIELVEQHIKEEERNLFPAVKEMFEPDELKTMGNQILEVKGRVAGESRELSASRRG